MKNLFFSTILGLILFSATLFAQDTQTFTYNGIAVNAVGQRLTNHTISLRLSVLNGSATGSAIYVETQTAITNATGIYYVGIGQGNPVSGSYGGINWATNHYYLKVEMDPAAGTNYSIVSASPMVASLSPQLGTLASLTTTPTSGILTQTATSGGNIMSDGGSAVTARGVCWSVAANPTTADSHTTDGSGPGVFTSNISGLTPGTFYHIRSYATNSAGTAYGDIGFTTLSTPSVVTSPISSINANSAISGGNVTNDGGTTITARGVCWSTTANPTIASNHTTDGTGTGTFVSSIGGLSANTLYYVRAYATTIAGTAYGSDFSFTTLAFTCGSPFTINHLVGSVAPISKTVTYGTVTNIPGATAKCWITSNLGADHQATTISDATEASAGWYWQFNRKQGYKHDGSTLTPSWTITSINEYSDWIIANDPCTSELGTGWRLPTSTEWTNVNASGNWNNWSDPWNSGLKLHPAGYVTSGVASLDNRGSYGVYWSSSQYNSGYGWHLDFGSSNSFIFNGFNKAFGFSVRCLRD